MEPLNSGNEAVKSSRRRLSSILKASRTSMKVLGSEQGEQTVIKEEIAKPVEKKRNSRRVSFATTNNVRVFTNDAKSEPPVLASIQNTHVEDRPDEKILRFVDEGNHQIKGLETLLNTPLYLSQHKENFFSDPVLQDDCVDRTMLLGENTGYMDITQSHTITIDKDYEIEEEPDSDCSFKVTQTVCGDLNVASQKGLPREAKAESKKAATDPDFSAFLAGMCLPTVNTIKPPNSEKELESVFCSANTSTMEIDKENHLPSFLMKQHPGGKGNPKQPQGLQRRRSRVTFIEDDDIEPTMCHTVVFENRYDSQPLAPSISENQGRVAFLTSASLSQTAPINVKVTENITRDVQAALDRNRSHYFSEDDNAMEMTGAFDLAVREKDHTMNMKEQSQSPIPKVRRMSSFDVIGKGETTEQNITGCFQSNLSIVKTANSDDMEITRALDVSIREKEDILFPKLSRMSTLDAFGNGEIVDQNKSGNNLIAPTANKDVTEKTQSQAVVFETKPSSGNKSFSNSRKSFSLASISRTVQEDEHAGIIKEEALHPISRGSKMSCFNLVGNEEILDHNKSGYLSIAQTANSDDMEMTQCQSIFPEAKQVSEDTPLSNSRKNWPHTSVSRTEDGDGMDITQGFTGRIILNALSATKNERGGSILIPATSPKHNESDCMDLTCQPSTFAGISPPSPDEMELTGCNTMHIDSNRACLGIADTGTVPFSANQTITVVVPMEMTEVHMAPVSERKHKALMTRRKSGAGMSLTSYPENTEAYNCQTNFSNPDDMDMTQCQTQTVVLEAEYGRPFSKSRKSLNLVSTSSSHDVDGMEITQALTGNIMLKSFVSDKERKHESNLLPTAQSCQRQDEFDCMELTCQASASNLAIPCVDDEMELTGCNTIVVDSKSTMAASASEIKANESALWASTSVYRCTVSGEEQNEVIEAAKCANNHVFPSKHLDGKNLKCNYTETMSCDPAEMQENKYCEMAHPSNVMTTDDENVMQITNILTMPIEMEKSVLFDQREANINPSNGSRNEEESQALWSNKEQSTSSVQHEGSSSNESVADSFSKEQLKPAKARRRSLADFQMELQNISRRIQEEEKVMTGSKTAPLPSCSFLEISLKEQLEPEISTEPALNVTPNVKQKNNSVQNEKTTPFSLKKPFSSRLSLCGIVPKLPKRATTVTPNKTVTIGTKDLRSLQLEKHFEVVEQNSNCKTVNINDEEFPEMSSEEDISGTLENWPINKQDELDGSLAVPINEELFEDDVFDPGTSPCFKRPYPEEDPITSEQTEKAYISDMGPDCHEAAVQWEGNFTKHAAQNPKAKKIEDTGVSESTLRYSQFDSHLDGTLDNVFEFNKKLEDGSITLNEFLSHFGINFVIHRSRPSALPDNCRAGDTRTMEDLLKEKYIYHPKQRVYEQDCKNLTEIVESLKEQMPEQEKSLGCINGALQQQICTLSKEQLKSFGSKLKERRLYFGKRSKAHSHEIKGVLYSELIKTTQDAKESLISKIKETDGIMEDLDGCINDLETELATVEAMIMRDHLNAPQSRPALKAKEEDLKRLNSDITVKEREIGELEIQLRTLEGQQEKLRGDSSSLKSQLATLNSLNEWRLDATDERGALFTFLHNTVHLQVNLQIPAGTEWMTEDVERSVDVCFQLQLDVEKSECHASMVHKLLTLYCQSQTQWTQRYPTTRHISELLHDISLVVGRLRLLGEEIHRLKKWGGLKLRILKITCMDTQVHIVFSSLKASEKFELSLMVTPDYPFGPLHIQDFKKHMGNTRLSQIEDILSSVKPAKNYLTKILKKIHDDLLC
ncbi:hypothetical protein R3I93_006394 [Phoxinus phoxinus]|uniref:Knl1 C-terminal RWD domain-containing protein n=1 Tax=Phoxinus phoxinus TaxID=58324 RepID=A0AAN9HBJ0_9TELE